MKRGLSGGLLWVGLLAFGCGRVERRPPIVLISIDTLRSDRLPAYGYRQGATPALDSLANDSLLFRHAFAEVPLTLPSHASLFTGQLPPAHGVRDNVGFEFSAACSPLLAERLRRLGYDSFGAVSAQVLARRTGIAAGFDTWDEPEQEAGAPPFPARAERPGSETVRAATSWLEHRGNDERPFLLFVHLYEPHSPYRPPEPFRSRFADPYDGEIATADSHVGELLRALRARGLYDDSLIVFFSDHGEGLGDHGEDEHGLLLYREALQVPLLVKLPRSERARERIERNVALIDLTPTILELLDLPREPALPGLSLLAPTAPSDRALLAETAYPLIHFGWSDLASVIAGDLHLVSGRRDELFDFVRDPAETRDRLADERRSFAAMRRLLDGADRALAPPRPVDVEAMKRLGALGYLGQAALPEDRSNLPDPRDRVSEVAPLLRGIRGVHEGDFARAIELLRGVIERDPSSPHAWQYLGASYDALGRRAEAAAAYEQGSRLTGSSASLAETAVLRLLEIGRAQAALDLARDESGRHPENAVLRVLLSRSLLQTGRVAEATQAADAAVAIDGNLADAFYQRAVVALARRDSLAAMGDLERAAALDSRHLEARKALAMLRFAQGDAAEARRLLVEVLAVDSGDEEARADLARLDSERRGGA